MTRHFTWIAAVGGLTLALSSQVGTAKTKSTGQFGDITARVQRLWKSDQCFVPTAVEAIDACWKQSARREQAAQSTSLALIAELDAILTTTPNYSASLQTKLNLLTKAGLFCNARLAEPQQRAFWAKSYSSFYEYSNDLLICAQTRNDQNVYDELRGAINGDIARYSAIFQRELLKLWLDSYIRQFSPNGDLHIIATAINENESDTWQEFTGHIRYVAVKYGRFPSKATVKEFQSARRYLYSG